MPWHQRRTKKNPKITKNLYLMKLRHVAVRCVFCDYLYSGQEEINRLNAIVKNHKNCMKRRYIDTVLWKEMDYIACNECSDCLGGSVTRHLTQWHFDVVYKFISKKLL